MVDGVYKALDGIKADFAGLWTDVGMVFGGWRKVHEGEGGGIQVIHVELEAVLNAV